MLLDTPICDFGWNAPDFTLKDAHGRAYAMREQIGENGLLIAFLCNHCPYVQAIGHRLAKDAETLKAAGINVLAVMSNDYRDVPIDGPAYMPKFAEKFGWSFPYLVDEDQSVGQTYGAVCTPDFFGFNVQGELQYRGRLDNAGMRDPKGRKRELVEAMQLVALTGQGPRQQIPSMGCSIKWAR
ncbi:thiol-disulfide oxidoreductase [Roseovarius albus]|uniref:Thiol-disulfide oxidoreductase n=1 Tax=Roseovarius albus TaxID=1247867 RepID=A0A1X6ZPN7_9RHOB|nr:thioredoxin family protein [Roseovarius albus]SLN57388.1 thiol-disulfide oxidoreductase [Roseovarius albus]